MPAVTTKVAFENMLHFDGKAREALGFYQSLFGGELSIMTYGDSPMPDRPDDPPRDHVMHARLAIAGGPAFMACDVPPGMYEKPQGYRFAVSVASVDEGKRLYDALSDGAQEIVMEFQSTFWSPGFGMVNDRYGTPWMINTDGDRAPK